MFVGVMGGGTGGAAKFFLQSGFVVSKWSIMRAGVTSEDLLGGSESFSE